MTLETPIKFRNIGNISYGYGLLNIYGAVLKLESFSIHLL